MNDKQIEAAAREIHAQSEFASFAYEKMSEATQRWYCRRATRILAAAEAVTEESTWES